METAEVCIIGDGKAVFVIADLISKSQLADGTPLKARIFADLGMQKSLNNALDYLMPAGISDSLNPYLGPSDVKHTCDDVVVKIKHHTRRKAMDARTAREKFMASQLLTGLEAAATGNSFIDLIELLQRENVSVESFGANHEFASAFVFACPATAYGAHLDRLAGAIGDGSTVILVGAPILAGLEFNHQLNLRRPGARVNVIEMDELYSTVVERPDGSFFVTPARRVNIAGPTRNETRRAMWLASLLSRDLMPASGLIERGLLDAQSIVRPLFLLSAMLGAKIDALGDLSRLLNRANLAMLVDLEQELNHLALAAHCQPVDFARSLREEADLRGLAQGPVCDVTLAEALVTIAGKWFSGTSWSYGQAQYFLSSYVAEHLVPLAQLARVFDLAVPVLDSVIQLASSVVGTDLVAVGRTFDAIGLVNVKRIDLLEMTEA
ncbi:MAG: hypothetical protein IPI39_22905 [Candidatus Obscuribacter sp.]|jgi:hypothetical protein|nr:hypothetical protein [Candidatus Obscuribacter sp.]MBK9620548.1 hypothetical protein [Candidatus Obscuribacter sp.]